MYAETGLINPYLHNFSQEVQQFEDYFCSQNPNVSPGASSIEQAYDVSDYNLWGEGDLFKAPQPVIEEPIMGLDPMMAAISLISCGEDGISPQSLSMSDIESSIKSGQLLSEVFYECRKDIMAKEGNETPLSEVLSINIPPVKTDFPAVDFEAVYGMLRAFSEGDINVQTLGIGNVNHTQSPRGLPRIMSSCTSEGRKEKLSRYWGKKAKRNFGRKIEYACRKVVADSQPRIRGRFAKTEETEGAKKQ